MLVFCAVSSLIYFSIINGEPMSDDLYHTLFGNLWTMQDLFLNESELPAGPLGPNKPGVKKPEANKPGDKKPEANKTVEDIEDDAIDDTDYGATDVFQLDKNVSQHAYDIHDFNLANEKYLNLTREVRKSNLTRRFVHFDYDDVYFSEYIEEFKKDLLYKLLIQFIMHSRYEIGKALTQREKIRNDKRYKLGYLFNRLRRLKTEQLKMISVAWYQNQTTYRHMYSLMNLYERVLHFDVDMRDTCRMIKKIYSKEEAYDVLITHKKKSKGPDENH